MNFTSFFRIFLLSISTLFLFSCDKDFNELGADIIGDDHFGFIKDESTIIVANNVATGPVQSNNLLINPLGIYTNAAFGTTTANFVTQVELAEENPTFTNIENEPEVISVLLSIPYYNTYLSTNSDGEKIFELDSIYGPAEGKMKLSVYRNRYFLQNIDHQPDGTQQQQRYYSDLDADINSMLQPGDLLNDSGAPSQNEEFYFSANSNTETYTDSQNEQITDVTDPGMHIFLNKEKFQEWILNAPASELQSNNVFKNYFRGLYFKVEDIGQNAQLAMLNFQNGKIIIRYKEDLQTSSGVVPVYRSMQLNLKGNSVSLLNNSSENPVYTSAISQPFQPAGVPKIFLKGGHGSLATIDLFGPDTNFDDIPEQLQTLRDHVANDGWQINEANLTFYVDETPAPDGMGGVPANQQPLRIFLYDVKNKIPLIDYLYDNSGIASDESTIKAIHGGVRGKKDGKTMYKIKLTNYVRSLAVDSTNVKLGLSVTKSITFASMAKLKNANPLLYDFIPVGSVYHQLGTILHGNNIPETDENYDKRLKLEIYYTKPD